MMSERRFSNLRMRLIDWARGTDIRPRYADMMAAAQWDRKRIAALQTRKLVSVLQFASTAIPFYQDLYSSVLKDRHYELSGADLVEFPVVTKTMIKAAPERFQVSRKSRKNVVSRKTGGSTGAPFAYLSDPDTVSAMWASLYRFWSWTGFRLGDSMATIGGGSVAQGSRFSMTHLVYDFLRNNRSLDGAHLGPETLCDILVKHPIKMVYGYPSLIYQAAPCTSFSRGSTFKGPGSCHDK